MSEPPGPYRESDTSSDSSTDEQGGVDRGKPPPSSDQITSLPISAASSQGSVFKHPLLLSSVRSNSLPIAELPSPTTIPQQVSEAEHILQVRKVDLC